MTHLLHLPRRAWTLSLLVILGCAGLLPAAAHAGGSVTAPAAVSFNLSIQATVQGSPFNATVIGVANQNGDEQATVTYGGHSFSVITLGGVEYESEDGGPYRTSGATDALGSDAQAGCALTPSCVEEQPDLSTLFRQALASQGAGSALGLQDLGPATVHGLQAEHLQGAINLGQATLDPQVMQALSPLLAGCGGGDQAAALLPLVLAGATMNIDAYADPSTGVPLQFDLNVAVPFIGANFDLSGQMTPLTSPATIAAPS